MADIDLEKLKGALEQVNKDIDSLDQGGLHDIGSFLSPYYADIEKRKDDYPELYKLLDDTLLRIKKLLKEKE